MSCEFWGSPVWLTGVRTLFCSVWATGTVSSNRFRCFFLQPQLLSSQAKASPYSAENLKGTLCRSLQFSLCADLSCPEPCPVNSRHLSSLTPSFISPIQSPLYSPDSPSQGCGLKTLLSGEQGNYRAHLILVSCLSGITVLCCLMPSVLKTTVSYIWSFCFGWLFRVNRTV